MSTPFLNRDAIFRTKNDLKTESVEALGGTILIRELSAGKAAKLVKAIGLESTDALLEWIVASVIDPESMLPMFTAEDTPALAELPAAEILKVANAAIKLNGFDAETTAKNSGASPS